MPLTYQLASKIAKDFWFSCVHQVGSHTQWKTSSASSKVTIPRVKDILVETWRSIIKQISNASGVSFDEIVKRYQIKF